MTATDTARELALVAAQAAADKGAGDILILDVSDRLALTDCFLLATGASDRQVSAIVDAVTEKLAARVTSKRKPSKKVSARKTKAVKKAPAKKKPAAPNKKPATGTKKTVEKKALKKAGKKKR